MTYLVAAAAALLVAAAPGEGRPLHEIAVPAGFDVDVYASGLRRPTAMAYGPDGRLYVTQETGEVVVARRGRRPHVFASGFRSPLGITWVGPRLFVSQQGLLEALRVSRGRVVARRTLLSGLPYGRHQQDNVVVGPDGRL